ncbi:uncharacterized protein FOBCDRAFT_145007, partial [Fusarium oxysporum Fo47]|uniref:uncharacterized protein n=1 Tax=Fusarium oxysporum Fo47 TaxID=660027 RepID=UPI00286986F2
AEELYSSLIYSLKPNIDLVLVMDNLPNLQSRYCFIKYLINGLKLVYKELLIRAYLSSRGILARNSY